MGEYQIFLHVVDGHVKTDFFMLTIFLPWGIFSIHHICKKIKKGPEQKKFLYPKISFVRPISCANKFLKYALYFQTFLQELQMAASIPILRMKSRGLYHTYIL